MPAKAWDANRTNLFDNEQYDLIKITNGKSISTIFQWHILWLMQLFLALPSLNPNPISPC